MAWLQKGTAQTEHEYVDERLSPYLDDQLSPQERSIVEHHLTTCADCQWSLDTLRLTVQWTRELPTVPVPRVFTIPVPAQPERARRWRWSLPAFQAATALVAVLLVFAVAGNMMLSSFAPTALPEPAASYEQIAADVQPTEVTVEEVIVEKEAAPTAEEVSVEEPMLAPSPSAVLDEALPTEVVEQEVEAAASPTGEVGAMGVIGFASPSPEGPPPEAAAEEARVAAPEGAATEELVATEATDWTPTPMPTVAPTAAPPTAAPSPTMAATTVAEAAEPAAPLGGDAQPASALREPVATWLGVAQVVLAVAFVLLATTTVVLMIRRRRA
jgi:predicted anti-sigma-YlaC factor YlaD